jgi:hypothetical protein
VRVEPQAREQRGEDDHQIALTPAAGSPARFLDQRLQVCDAPL